MPGFLLYFSTANSHTFCFRFLHLDYGQETIFVEVAPLLNGR